MAQKKLPDRFHRQFANLFMEVDARVLLLFLRISNLLDEVNAEWAGIIVAKRKTPDPFFRGPPQPGPPVNLPRYELQIFRDKMRYDAIAFEIDDLREACSIFVRNSILTTWTGEGWEHPHPHVYEVDELIGIIDERQMERWQDLREYVLPLADDILAAEHNRLEEDSDTE